MLSYRFIAITIAVSLASYAGVHELFRVRQLMPNPNLPTFHRVGTSDDPRYNHGDPYESDNDEVRDNLRRMVQTTASNLLASPCNAYLKDKYIDAATKYARAWLSIAPCMGLKKCTPSEDAQLFRAQKAFTTPFDRTVQELMRQVHDNNTIREGDFAPQNVTVTVALLAQDIVLDPLAGGSTARNVWKKHRRESTCPL